MLGGLKQPEMDPYRSQRPPPGSRRGAGTLECPGCLAHVDASVRHCPTCGTPIATLRCGQCFQMNPPTDALCLGCGHELGLEPLGEPDHLHCPDCKTAFNLFGGSAGALHDCEKCGGQFVDHPLLRDLLEQREAYGRSAPRPPPRHNPLDSPMRYVACPVCRDMMTRRNFGRSSGVIIDVCSKHGVWFDRGELPRVLSFVEAGGLALSRARDQDDERSQERRERVQRIEKELEGLRGASTTNPFERSRRYYELGEASSSLLGYLSDLLRE